MNRILSLFVLFAFFAVNLFAATPTITVTLADFTADFSGAGYVVRITPSTGGTAARALTDSDGVASFATVTPGIYALSIEGAGVPTLQIRVPNTASTTAASAIVISNWTPPSTGTITSGIWENAAGTIKPTANGQNRNTLQFTSGLADAADNVAFAVDTENVWTADDEEKLLTLRHAGTNVAYITQWGAIEMGRDLSSWAPDKSDVLVSIRDPSLGESSTSYITTRIVHADNSTNAAHMELRLNSTTDGTGDASLDLTATIDGVTDTALLLAEPTAGQTGLYLRSAGVYTTRLSPTIASTGTAIAYTFNTSNQLTNGDNIVSFQNTNAVRFAVDHAGAVTAADAITAGALVTGTGFISASGYAAIGSTNRWKTGIVTTGATVALNLTNYVNITINGVTYKLGLVQ